MTYRSPIFLDLFCGAGGAATGLHCAGINTVGIDIKQQPDYPANFICGDVFGPVGDALIVRARTGEFDAIWASPPCKKWSVATGKTHAAQHPDLVTPTRELLLSIGLPYVIENVIDAPIRPDLFLCGEMFDGLKVLRHRHFEIGGFSVDQPLHFSHARGPRGYCCVAGKGWRNGRRDETKKSWHEEISAAMGITHIKTVAGVVQSVPPAYAAYIAGFFLSSFYQMEAVA